MNWHHLFFAFDGRIARAHFWAGVLILLAVQLAVLLPILHLFESDLTARPPALWFRNLSLLVDAFLAWPSLAVLAKRQQDRGHKPHLAYLAVVTSIAFSILDAFGLVQTSDGYTPLGTFASMVSLGVMAVVIVELGLRPGAEGPNAFGKPPE